MFVAQLNNKLSRPEENMEDLLTSNVFGVWRYLPPSLGLLQFLETAQRLDGTMFPTLIDIESVNLQFWPKLRANNIKGTEPDVLIEMISSTQIKTLILIESKYLSEKSSYTDDSPQPNDQLV